MNCNQNMNNYLNMSNCLNMNLNNNSNEIVVLKNQLNSANKTIIELNKKINILEDKLNKNNINLRYIQQLKDTIYLKDQELLKLKIELQNKNIINNQKKPLFSIDQMICVNFVSMDSKIHYAIPCVGNNIFAEIEEKLYQKFQNTEKQIIFFLANGKQVLRFKTIAQNNIGNGLPITLVVPNNN